MSFSMSGGSWNYNRFDEYEKRLEEEKKSLAAKCDPKGKVTRRDVIAAGTGDCGDGKKVNEETIEEKKELPDFIKKKVEEKEGKKSDDKDDKKKSKKDDCECKEEVELEEGSCGGGYQKGGMVGYQKGGEVKDKKKITKEDVLDYMITNGMANNVVSAEVIFEHITDDFLITIEENIEEGMNKKVRDELAIKSNALQDAVKNIK